MKKFKYAVLGILIALTITLSACGHSSTGTSYPSTAEMTINLEKHGYTVEVSDSIEIKETTISYAVYQAKDTNIDDFENKMQNTFSSLKSTFKEKGYCESNVTREEPNKIRVEIPGVDDPKIIPMLIGESAYVRFVLDSTGEIVITSFDILKAEAGYDSQSEYIVQISLNSEGKTRFAEVTANNIGGTIRIYLGDSEIPISSPTINSAIPNGQAIITGFASYEDAQERAKQISDSSSNIPLTLIENQSYTKEAYDCSGSFIYAQNGDDFIVFCRLQSSEHCDDVYRLLETTFTDSDVFVQIENDEKNGNIVYCGTTKAVEYAGISVIKTDVKI